jgi:hypothetical protein
MSTAEILKPHQLVGKIKSVVIEELADIDQRSTSAEERNASLTRQLTPRQDEFRIGSQSFATFMNNAVSDMWLLSRSGLNYLQEREDKRESLEDSALDTISRSVSALSFPAIVPGESWEYKIKPSWLRGDKNYGSLIPQKKFQLQRDDNGLQVVGFSSGAMAEIDSYSDVRGTSGCPAKGAVLNSIFAKYIEVIYSGSSILETIEILEANNTAGLQEI